MPAAKKTPAFAPPAIVWGNTVPCVATYNVLEHDDKMDQFEDQDHPFAGAGSLTMGQLRFWPGVSLPAGAIDDIALLKAQEFLKLVAKHFTSKKTDPALSSATVLRATAKVFGKKSGTLVELAAILAASFAFPTHP